MKLQQAHIEKIKLGFEKMQSKEDLLHLLNEVKPLVYTDKAVPFELKQLTWYANPNLGKARYTEFKIKKKSGEDRSIHAPVKGLKSLQRTLSCILQCVFEPHKAALGFVRGRSIVDNARLHEGSRFIYNIDLKDFFPSIDQARVWKCLQLKPFNLNKASSVAPQIIKWKDFERKYLRIDEPLSFQKEESRMFTNTPMGKLYVSNNLDEDKDRFVLIGRDTIEAKGDKSFERTLWLVNQVPNTSRLDLANIIASLCCTSMEVERKNKAGEWKIVKSNVLPQGAPTSPVITNIICHRLDLLLTGVAKRFGLKYSRYADDITFSSLHDVYQPESDFLQELHRIINEQGFRIKESKTRLQKDGYRKEVTGLIVNEKVNVQQRYIKQLRMWLYYWETYGYERANIYFLKQYLDNKVQVNKGKPDMVKIIAGKLDYMKMVKGAENDLYLKLKTRFAALSTKNELKKDNAMQILLIENTHNSPVDVNLVINDLPKLDIYNTSNTLAPLVKHENLFIQTIHNPKGLVSLLKKFSDNNSALKYTTHSWDAGRDANMFKDLSEFLSLAHNQYNEFSFQLNSLSRNLHGKINNFLFNKEISETGWGDANPTKRIRFGWSSPELIEACRLDASLAPEDFILPAKYQLQRAGKTIQKFKHVIDVFKNEIEIRDENSALLNLILQKHDTYLIGFTDPIITNLDNKTFYTDVQWFSKALDLIFENIQIRPQHRQVSYSIKNENEDIYVLEILHVGSFNLGKSILDEKLRLVKGSFGDVYKYLRNLCDWSIESQFIEGCYRINCLTSDSEDLPHKKIASAEGFKHILTFYK